jgi:hypothetical protein
MNDLLKQRILRALETLNDERGYQILDYVEFLESKYAERQKPTGVFAKLTETVEDTMRAGKLPFRAITGTMGFMDGAAKVMKGLAAAGQAVVDEAVRATETTDVAVTGPAGGPTHAHAPVPVVPPAVPPASGASALPPPAGPSAGSSPGGPSQAQGR